MGRNVIDDPYLMNLARITVFALMLHNGVSIPLRDIFSLQRRPALLIRSMGAVLVLVPGVVLLILTAVDLPVEVATGLALLASSPGAPLTTQRAKLAAGNVPFATDLQLKLVLAAVLVTPLALMLFKALFPLLPELATSPTSVAREIALVSLLPVGVGLSIQHFLPRAAKPIGAFIDVVAKVLLLLLAAFLVWPAVQASIRLGGVVVIVIVFMAAAALAIGHMMGANAPLRECATLATACVARNLGLAVVIAGADGILPKLLPTIIAYMLLGMLVAAPYAVWVRRNV